MIADILNYMAHIIRTYLKYFRWNTLSIQGNVRSFYLSYTV